MLRPVADLPCVVELRRRRRVLEQRRTHEMVVDDDVARGEEIVGSEREERRIARAGTDEVNRAWNCGRSIRTARHAARWEQSVRQPDWQSRSTNRAIACGKAAGPTST